MSLRHLKAMRDYRPPRKKDHAATNFLWILAERAGSGAKYKNGYQSEFGWTNSLSDKKLMEQLGTERRETCRQLRIRFRKARAIKTVREHCKSSKKKSKFPVYRYFLDVEWLKAQAPCRAERGMDHAAENAACASSVERTESQSERALNAALTRNPSDNWDASPAKNGQDSAGSGEGWREAGSSPLPSTPTIREQANLSPEELSDLEYVLKVSLPVLEGESGPAIHDFIRSFAATAKYNTRSMFEFLAMSTLQRKIDRLADLDERLSRRLRAAWKSYVEKGEERDGDADRVLDYIDRQWEAVEERLHAAQCPTCGLTKDECCCGSGYSRGGRQDTDEAGSPPKFEITVEDCEEPAPPVRLTCPGCGKEYDVGRKQFDSAPAIHCRYCGFYGKRDEFLDIAEKAYHEDQIDMDEEDDSPASAHVGKFEIIVEDCDEPALPQPCANFETEIEPDGEPGSSVLSSLKGELDFAVNEPEPEWVPVACPSCKHAMRVEAAELRRKPKGKVRCSQCRSVYLAADGKEHHARLHTVAEESI
jgi:predicted Zn finger-like uncharacterized protein